MADNGETIAADILAFLEAGSYSLDFEASVPESPAADLYREGTTLRVLIVPSDETETKENRSQVFIEPQVTVIIVGPLSLSDRAGLQAFVNEIRQSLRFENMAGWVWQQTELLTKFDSDALRKGLFVSALKLTYQGIE